MSESDSLPCSECHKYHPSSNFSKGQLSKGGRRKCQTCLSPGAQKAVRAQQQKSDEAQRQLQLKAQQEKAERERQKQEEERKQREERERIAREAEAARQKRQAEEQAQREAETAARKLLQPQAHEGFVLPTMVPKKQRRNRWQRQDQSTLNEYRAFRENLQSPTCASQGTPDAEYPKFMSLDTLIATPISTSTELNPLVARIPTDVWRIVIEMLKKTQLPPTETNNPTTDPDTLKSMHKFEAQWGAALRSRSCILSLLQSCRAVYLQTRPLFSNHLENYLALVKGYYNFEHIVVSYKHNFPRFPFAFCCSLEDDGICRGSMQIFDREKKVEFDSYDLLPHFAPTLADNHEETINQGTSNIRRPGEIRVEDLLPKRPAEESSLQLLKLLATAPKGKEANKGWSLHHITLRLFAKHDSLIASGTTVHERSKFLFSDYSTTDAKTQRVPFFETNLFVDVTPFNPAPKKSVLEPNDEQFSNDEDIIDDASVSLDEPKSEDEPPLPSSLSIRPGSPNVPQLLNNSNLNLPTGNNNSNNSSKSQRPRLSQFVICRGNAAPNSNTNETNSGEQFAVKLLTPREFYDKQESHPVRVEQRDLEQQFRQEFNRNVDQDRAWSGIPSRHRPHLKDTSDPAHDIQTKFGNSVVKISEYDFNNKFSEAEDLIIREEDRSVD